jgi:hypothetical protein
MFPNLYKGICAPSGSVLTTIKIIFRNKSHIRIWFPTSRSTLKVWIRLDPDQNPQYSTVRARTARIKNSVNLSSVLRLHYTKVDPSLPFCLPPPFEWGPLQKLSDGYHVQLVDSRYGSLCVLCVRFSVCILKKENTALLEKLAAY